MAWACSITCGVWVGVEVGRWFESQKAVLLAAGSRKITGNFEIRASVNLRSFFTVHKQA